MNSKIYQRNHFCVSFVILKTRADGTPDETSVKIFFLRTGTTSFPSTARSRTRSRSTRKRSITTTPTALRTSCSRCRCCRRSWSASLSSSTAWACCRASSLTSARSIRAFHHQPRQHQHGGHLPPLLRVRHDGRVRLHGQAHVPTSSPVNTTRRSCRSAS